MGRARRSVATSLVLSIVSLRGYAAASIPITRSLPSTPTFDAALASLSRTADSLTGHVSIAGLPGTAIDRTSDFESLQAYLDCTAANGEWVHDPLGTTPLPVHKMDSKFATCDKRYYHHRSESDKKSEWDVRESLKYHFVPSAKCSSLLESHLVPRTPLAETVPSRTRLCQLLAHKAVLLVGSTTQYSLHDLLLDYTTTQPQSCYGDLYCKEHALCGGILDDDDDDDADSESVEDWTVDERVYERLPLPPRRLSHHDPLSSPERRDHHRSDVPPPPNELGGRERRREVRSLYPSSTYSTLLRYRRSDGLCASSSSRDDATSPTYQHAFSHVREQNQPWLADARRSDVVVIEKPPIPLPLEPLDETYPKSLYDYFERQRLRIRGGGHDGDSEEDDDDDDADDEEEEVVDKLVRAVSDVTERVWLPELIEALERIRTDPRSRTDQLVVYRSGWRTHHDCATAGPSSGGGVETGNNHDDKDEDNDYDDDDEDRDAWTSPGDGPLAPLRVQPNFDRLVFRTSPMTTTTKRRGQGRRRTRREFQPLDVVYHNLQIVVQNELARRVVLPKFGIAYLDLENPLSVWRTGLLGGSTTTQRGLRSSTSGDCHRYCFPSPGLAIEGAFVGALSRLFEVAWTGVKGREHDWVGDEFRNLRMRLSDRAATGGPS